MKKWKSLLRGQIPVDLGEEIDIFETQISLRKQNKLDEKIFAETRLRRGAYGQRYDNGQRHDGVKSRPLAFPSDGLTKGPDTAWDAPGMQRIKIPFGAVSADQLDVLAALAEEYSDGILHVTTRQDIQFHYLHIEETPDMMRRLAAVGITTREACGNVVRNVTACPLSGVCQDESFDVTPYAQACAQFLLGHPDAQDFGRKFKVTFSGCKDKPCGLVSMHDLGFIAKTRKVEGNEIRGFEMYVGGGLGAVPYQAVLFDDFILPEEIFPLAQAISRVYARLGEKKNRGKARIKFLIAQKGIEEFKRLVLEERDKLPKETVWGDYLKDSEAGKDHALKEPVQGERHGVESPRGGKRAANVESPSEPRGSSQAMKAPVSPKTLKVLGGSESAGGEGPEGKNFAQWRDTNVLAQKQKGYVVVKVTLALGDMTADQTRWLAEMSRKYTGDTVRFTVDQNLVFRWVLESDIGSFYKDLESAGLAEAGADTITDVSACPGTDTCKLGIASSRGLAAELRRRLLEQSFEMEDSVRALSIKISGCFNACSQHSISDLGFYGVSRNFEGYTVPHFQVVLGGERAHNAGAYGLAMGAVPSRRIPEVVSRVTERFVQERGPDESFRKFVNRIGKKEIRNMFEDLVSVPSHDQDASYYSDWGDPREFTIQDMGVGECAGEVVSKVEFGLSSSERQVFEAQIFLDDQEPQKAAGMAYKAMLAAARALVQTQFEDISEDPQSIVTEFRTRFFDTKIFFDTYAAGKFAQYFFRAHENLGERHGVESPRGGKRAANVESPSEPQTLKVQEDRLRQDAAHHRVEEAQLFIEAAYRCYGRMTKTA